MPDQDQDAKPLPTIRQRMLKLAASQPGIPLTEAVDILQCHYGTARRVASELRILGLLYQSKPAMLALTPVWQERLDRWAGLLDKTGSGMRAKKCRDVCALVDGLGPLTLATVLDLLQGPPSTAMRAIAEMRREGILYPDNGLILTDPGKREVANG